MEMLSSVIYLAFVLVFILLTTLVSGTKICIMELFTLKRLDSYQYVQVEEVRCLFQNLIRSTETPVVIKDHLFTINLNIMSRIVLGRKYM
ncbi:hypothetical protein OPV22_016924 [Ensete ventricosum]|uniref:Uncharacterized protein n=1 Tax=Ensete ventricosum TaxID=4639 RepID=A0AAV8R0X9_ENSVE|nr:hypothetical protein OPV22_016924 [Ensete ventricosum]